MAVDITILVGTMTGTAEMVAQEVQQALETAGHQAKIQVMDGLDASVFQSGSIFLICTSTYGNGDVPDNAQALFSSLETEKPDLSSITYGVIALGDTTYKDTFCQGGIRFDKMLTELGAKRAGEMLMHDAGSGTLPEEVAAQSGRCDVTAWFIAIPISRQLAWVGLTSTVAQVVSADRAKQYPRRACFLQAGTPVFAHCTPDFSTSQPAIQGKPLVLRDVLVQGDPGQRQVHVPI